MLDAFTVSCQSLDEAAPTISNASSPVIGPSDECNASQILFQNPRMLGRGVDNFDENGIPQTPYMSSSRTEPPQLLLTRMSATEPPPPLHDVSTDGGLVKLTLDDSCFIAALSAGSNSGGNASMTSVLSSSLSLGIGSGSAPPPQLGTTRTNQLVLVRGGASFSGAHITLRLLQGGYNVRILARDCLTSTAELSELVKTRLPPTTHSRLLIFKGTELTDALEGCDFVVCNSDPETGDLVEGAAITKRYMEDMQDLFLSIHHLCRRTNPNPHLHHNHDITAGQPTWHPPRVVWISTAATVFPVATTSQPRSRMIIEAKALALKEAERIAKKADIPMVVLLPSVIVGSALTDTKGEANRLLAQLATSGQRYFPFAPSLAWNFVDVQDVAEATLAALSCDAAVHQRFLISESELSIAAIGKMLAHRFPTLPSPATLELPNIVTLVLLTIFGHLGERVSYQYLRSNLGRRYPLENHKARRKLGVKFHNAADAIVANVAETLGLIPVPPTSPVESSTQNCSLSTSSSYGSIGSAEASRPIFPGSTTDCGLIRTSSLRQSRSDRRHKWMPSVAAALVAATISLGLGFAAGRLAAKLKAK